MGLAGFIEFVLNLYISIFILNFLDTQILLILYNRPGAGEIGTPAHFAWEIRPN